MKYAKFIVMLLIIVLFLNIIAYAGEEGKAVKEVKFLMAKKLYENALVRANFYLNTNPRSLRVRKLKIDILIKLARFDEALYDYEIFIKYSKAKKENIPILSDILVSYLKWLRRENPPDVDKREVFALLSEIKDEKTIRELKEIYYFPSNREEKIWASSLLVQIGKSSYLKYLRKVSKLQDLTRNEKIYIILGFAFRGSEILRKNLLYMLKKEKDPYIVAYTYWALTKMGDNRRKVLRTMLNRVDDKVKSVILFLLGDLKDNEVSMDIHTKDKAVILSYYWLKYRRGIKSALSEIRKFLSSNDVKISKLSAFYVGLIGDKSSIPLLRHKIIEMSNYQDKLPYIFSIIRIIRKDRIDADIRIKIGFSVTL